MHFLVVVAFQLEGSLADFVFEERQLGLPLEVHVSFSQGEGHFGCLPLAVVRLFSPGCQHLDLNVPHPHSLPPHHAAAHRVDEHLFLLLLLYTHLVHFRLQTLFPMSVCVNLTLEGPLLLRYPDRLIVQEVLADLGQRVMGVYLECVCHAVYLALEHIDVFVDPCSLLLI